MPFFDHWSGPEGAEKYSAEARDLHDGRKVPEGSAGVTIKELANAYLNHKVEARGGAGSAGKWGRGWLLPRN